MTFTEFLFWLVIAVPPIGLLILAVAASRRERRADAMAEAHGDVPHVHQPESWR